MPPKGKLPDATIALLQKWVNDAAAWPDEPPPELVGLPGQSAAVSKSTEDVEPTDSSILVDYASSPRSRIGFGTD